MVSGNSKEVVVTDIRMPFGSMVVFMVKWAIAAIPALVILTGIWWITVALFGGMGMMDGWNGAIILFHQGESGSI